MNRILPLLSALILLASCHKEILTPANPLPFPIDANKDLTVAPGDDFFRYCNGTWLKNAQIPEGKRVYGGMYLAANQAKDRMAALYEEDPLLRKVMADARANQSRPEASQAYIDRLVSMLPDPAVTSTEEYIRLVGRFTRMGVGGLLVVYASARNGKLEITLFPECFATIVDGVTPPEPTSDRPGDRSIHFMELLAEGMGIDPSLVTLYEAELEDDVYADWLGISPEVLYKTIRSSILKLRRFNDSSTDLEDILDDVEDATSIYSEYLFARKYASPRMKETYTDICERMRAQFSRRIDRLDWMSDATKSFAQEKLSAMRAHVAYPDHWFPETMPTLEEIGKCGSFVEEYLNLRSHKMAFTLALGGKAAREYEAELYLSDGHEFSTVNAAYDTSINSLFVNSSVLLPPVISDDVTEARAYAAFAIVGHEMTHGFDVD